MLGRCPLLTFEAHCGQHSAANAQAIVLYDPDRAGRKEASARTLGRAALWKSASSMDAVH